MEKTQKLRKEEEEEYEEEEVEEEEDEVGEDFSKDPRAYTFTSDAGKIADEALKYVISVIQPGVTVYEACFKGDHFITEALKNVYTKKKYIKGIAFPTSISINEVCGNYSPINAEETKDENEYLVFTEGDVVKIDLGVQIHGFAAMVAHTIVVGNDVVSGKKADVILAAYNALQVALRLFNVGTNHHVTEAIKLISDDYKVSPVEGVLSHRMRRDIIDSTEVIINKATHDQKVDEREFQFGDVFALDIIVTSGEGKPKESTIKTSIYKRAVETTYKLKTESARKLLSLIEHNFYTFPFSLSSFENDENIRMTKEITNVKNLARMGLVECMQHDLVHPYPVLVEKKGEIVAQFKWTIAVRQDTAIVLAGETIDLSRFQSDYKVTDERALKLLEQPLDNFLPNAKKQNKIDPAEKARRKKEAKQKKKEEAKKQK